MKKTISFMITVLTVSLFAQQTFLFKSTSVPLREHARVNAKALGQPTEEDKAEFKGEQGDWIRVRTSVTKKDGWVMKSELLKTVEYGTEAAKVAAENEQLTADMEKLREDVNKYKNDKREADKELISTNKMLTKVQQKYTELREGATAFADLQSRFDSTVALLEEEKTKNEELSASVEVIKKNDLYRWFITGGLLVLISYLLGVSSRSGGGKKKKYNYR